MEPLVLRGAWRASSGDAALRCNGLARRALSIVRRTRPNMRATGGNVASRHRRSRGAARLASQGRSVQPDAGANHRDARVSNDSEQARAGAKRVCHDALESGGARRGGRHQRGTGGARSTLPRVLAAALLVRATSRTGADGRGRSHPGFLCGPARAPRDRARGSFARALPHLSARGILALSIEPARPRRVPALRWRLPDHLRGGVAPSRVPLFGRTRDHGFARSHF